MAFCHNHNSEFNFKIKVVLVHYRLDISTTPRVADFNAANKETAPFYFVFISLSSLLFAVMWR